MLMMAIPTSNSLRPRIYMKSGNPFSSVPPSTNSAQFPPPLRRASDARIPRSVRIFLSNAGLKTLPTVFPLAVCDMTILFSNLLRSMNTGECVVTITCDLSPISCITDSSSRCAFGCKLFSGSSIANMKYPPISRSAIGCLEFQHPDFGSTHSPLDHRIALH